MRARIALGVVALSLLSLVGLVTTAPGARLVFALVAAASGKAVVAEGVQGRLVGPLEIAQLRLRTKDADLKLEGLHVQWSPRDVFNGARGEIEAQRLDIEMLPSTSPPSVPASLALPVDELHLRLRVAQIVVRGAGLPAPQVASRLEATLDSDGRVHRVSGLSAQSHWGPLRGEGRIEVAAPFALEGKIEAGWTGEGLDFVARAAGKLSALDLTVDARGRELSGRGRLGLTPFAALPLSRLEIDFDAVNPARVLAGAPQADLTIHAAWKTERAAGALVLVGPVSVVNRTPGTLDADHLPLASAGALARVQQDSVTLDDLRIAIDKDGQVSGALTWRKPRVRGRLLVQGVNMAAIHRSLVATRLQGEIALESQDARVWTARGELRDRRAGAQFALSLAGDELDVSQLKLAADGGRASARGRLSLSGARGFHFEGEFAGFDPAQFVSSPRARLNGRFSAAGSLAPELQAALDFALSQSVLHTPAGVRPLAGKGRLSFAERRAVVDAGLDVAGNRLAMKGALGQPSDVLEVPADMPSLQLLGLGVSGSLSGFARLRGRIDAPRLELDIRARDLGVGSMQVARADVAGRLLEGEAGAIDLSARIEGVRAGSRAISRAGELTWTGNVRSNQWRTRIELDAAAGGGVVSARGEGALSEGFNWRGMLMAFDYASARFPLALVSPASLAMSPRQVAMGAAELQGRRARVKVAQMSWSPAGLASRGQLSGLRVSAPRWVAGGVQIGARWDVNLAAARMANVSIYRESGDIAIGGDIPVSVGLEDARLDAELAGSRLNLALFAVGKHLGEVAGNLALQLDARALALVDSAPVVGAVRLSVPALDWVGPLVDTNLRTAGAFSGELTLGGTLAEPQVRGALQGKGLGVALIDQGLRLQEGVLRVNFDQNLARLEEISFVVPRRAPPRGGPIKDSVEAGRVSARGSIDLSAAALDVDWRAEQAVLLSREGQWLMASGEGKLAASREGARVSGRTRIDAAVIGYEKRARTALSDDVVVLGREREAARRWRLDVDLLADLGERFYFSAQGLRARLEGQMRLRGQGLGALAASGSIRMVDGVFDAYGQTLSIERGVVNFQGPLDNPGLNVRAIRRGLAVEAGVEVSGRAQAPVVRLVSDPSVPDAEKLSWIVLGRGLDQAGAGGAADSALLLSAATAILGGRDGKGISQQLGRSLGFDEVSVGAAEGGASRAQTTVAGQVGGTTREVGLSGAVVQVGKRLSSSLHLSYEHSLLGLESVVKLTYALSRRLSVVGRAGTDNAVDVFYTFSFD